MGAFVCRSTCATCGVERSILETCVSTIGCSRAILSVRGFVGRDCGLPTRECRSYSGRIRTSQGPIPTSGFPEQPSRLAPLPFHNHLHHSGSVSLAGVEADCGTTQTDRGRLSGVVSELQGATPIVEENSTSTTRCVGLLEARSSIRAPATPECVSPASRRECGHCTIDVPSAIVSAWPRAPASGCVEILDSYRILVWVGTWRGYLSERRLGRGELLVEGGGNCLEFPLPECSVDAVRLVVATVTDHLEDSGSHLWFRGQ